MNYITQVTVISGNSGSIVDTFPFMYETISVIHCLKDLDKFTITVGEGLEINAKLFERGEELFYLRAAEGHGQRILSELIMKKSRVLYFLIDIVSDRARSASLAGIDAGECIEKFPPALFYLPYSGDR